MEHDSTIDHALHVGFDASCSVFDHPRQEIKATWRDHGIAKAAVLDPAEDDELVASVLVAGQEGNELGAAFELQNTREDRSARDMPAHPPPIGFAIVIRDREAFLVVGEHDAIQKGELMLVRHAFVNLFVGKDVLAIGKEIAIDEQRRWHGFTESLKPLECNHDPEAEIIGQTAPFGPEGLGTDSNA